MTGWHERADLSDESAGRRLYGIAEIAAALAVDRQLVTVWRRRSSRGMPSPDFELAAGPVWWDTTIEPWISRTRTLLAGQGSGRRATPALISTATRRMLRLAAILLEQPRALPRISDATTPLEELVPQLVHLPEEADATRRTLREVARLTEDLRVVLSRRDAAEDLDDIAARCLNLVSLLTRMVSPGATVGE